MPDQHNTHARNPDTPNGAHFGDSKHFGDGDPLDDAFADLYDHVAHGEPRGASHHDASQHDASPQGFAEASERARRAAHDPDEMDRMINEAEEKVGGPEGQSAARLDLAFVATFHALVRLIRAAMRGDYQTTWTVIATAVIAVAYVAVTVDVIPDFIPVVGLLDDAVVVGLSGASIRRELERFRRWEAMTR